MRQLAEDLFNFFFFMSLIILDFFGIASAEKTKHLIWYDFPKQLRCLISSHQNWFIGFFLDFLFLSSTSIDEHLEDSVMFSVQWQNHNSSDVIKKSSWEFDFFFCCQPFLTSALILYLLSNICIISLVYLMQLST